MKQVLVILATAALASSLLAGSANARGGAVVGVATVADWRRGFRRWGLATSVDLAAVGWGRFGGLWRRRRLTRVASAAAPVWE